MDDERPHRAVPYASDVRAKGWRFELDHERIRQSDTWALAPAEVRPWLLMLWMTAWEQAPCGSLPAADDLVAARIGMPLKIFTKHRACLMRGWWIAEDGRLYHNTLAERVLEMVTAKGKERHRKAEYRARKEGKLMALPRVPNLSHGTAMGQPRDSHGSDPGRDDTGTRTGTGTINTPPYPPRAGERGGGESAKPTKAETVCKAVEAKGITDADPTDLTLLAFIDKGVQVGAFEAAAGIAVKHGKDMRYLLGIIRRQVSEAAQVAIGPALQQGAWDANRSSIEAKAAELGMAPWNEHDLSANREVFPAYTARVRARLNALEVSA